MQIRLKNIESFLLNRDWTIDQEYGRLFNKFMPPSSIDIDADFFLEIPKTETSGFHKYALGLTEVIAEIYADIITSDDLVNLFSQERAVFSFRIADLDTVQNSLALKRYKAGIDSVFSIVKNVVIFISSKQQIFGNAKNEVINYINGCRAYQTQPGSYILKFGLPDIKVDLFADESVPNKLFEVLNFINTVVIDTPISSINEDHIKSYSSIINVELFTAIKNLYKNVDLRDGDFSILEIKKFNTVPAKKIAKHMTHLDNYIKTVKKILLEEIPLSITGIITRCDSKNPENGGSIQVETYIADEKEIVIVKLDNKIYPKAVTAHRLGKEVSITGNAIQRPNNYNIYEPSEFIVI